MKLGPSNNSIKNPDFKTHLNYISNLSLQSKNLSLAYGNRISVNKNLTKYKTKASLFNLTKQSIENESKIVQIDSSYAKTVCCWMPVKSYYLCFNLMLTILYLITTDENDFKKTHTGLIEMFTLKLKNKEFLFSSPIFNEVFYCTILDFKMQAGFNISTPVTQNDMENLYKLSMKKIAEYKKEEYRKREKLNLRKAVDKNKMEKYLKNTFQISIFDFLYQMRIRANYRDFAFIENVSDTEAKIYFDEYYSFLTRFIQALFKLYLEIKSKRGL